MHIYIRVLSTGFGGVVCVYIHMNEVNDLWCVYFWLYHVYHYLCFYPTV